MFNRHQATQYSFANRSFSSIVKPVLKSLLKKLLFMHVNHKGSCTVNTPRRAKDKFLEMRTSE